jgi:hypothetical protein
MEPGELRGHHYRKVYGGKDDLVIHPQIKTLNRLLESVTD